MGFPILKIDTAGFYCIKSRIAEMFDAMKKTDVQVQEDPQLQLTRGRGW